MTMPSRRSVLAASAATLFSGPFILRSARAAEFTFKFANTVPVTHPMNVRLKEAAARIAEETKGRFELAIFPSAQLGSESDLIGQIRSGAVDFYPISALILSTLVPAAAVSGLGFAFKDYDTVWKAMDGKLGDYIKREIAKINTVTALDRMWDSGFRQITSSVKPIESPKDLEGLKIRIPSAPMWTTMFKAFGSAPTAMNFAEVYSALQTKVIDAQENPLVVISSAKLNEVQRYCSLTNHMWDGFWVLCNKANLETLPEDIRASVIKNLNAAGLDQRNDIASSNSSIRSDLESKGMKFNAVDNEPFRAKLKSAGFFAEWKTRYGAEAWTLLEEAVGSLG